MAPFILIAIIFIITLIMFVDYCVSERIPSLIFAFVGAALIIFMIVNEITTTQENPLPAPERLIATIEDNSPYTREQIITFITIIDTENESMIMEPIDAIMYLCPGVTEQEAEAILTIGNIETDD